MFNDIKIDFEFSHHSDLMVNATQMLKAFPNKRMSDFTENKSTNDFIGCALLDGNSRLINVSRKEDLLLIKKGSTTWMHRFLAYKFAAWLSPEFELWLYGKIDLIVMGYYKKINKSLKESAQRKLEIEELMVKLSDNEDFQKLEDLRKLENKASRNRSKEQRLQLDVFKTDLQNNQEK